MDRLQPPSTAWTSTFRFRRVALFLIALNILNIANAQRAIASLGAKLKRFGKSGSKVSDGGYFVEGEEKRVSSFSIEACIVVINDWRSMALIASCFFVATIYIAASSANKMHQEEEGEFSSIGSMSLTDYIIVCLNASRLLRLWILTRFH